MNGFTDEMLQVAASLRRPLDSAEGRRAISILEDWTGERFAPTTRDDLGIPSAGVLIHVSEGTTIFSIEFVNAPTLSTSGYSSFEFFDRVIEGWTMDLPRAWVHEQLGPPDSTEKFPDRDRYSVPLGNSISLAWDATNGQLWYLTVSRPRPVVAPPQPPSRSLPCTIDDVYDEDGILALVDTSAYVSYIGSWTFDSLTAHFAGEAERERVIVFAANEGEFEEWAVDVRSQASRRRSTHDATAPIRVTDGALHLVGYTDLTRAAEDDSDTLPLSGSPDWRVDVPNGRYSARIRVLATRAPNGTRILEIVLRRSRTRAEKPGTGIIALYDH